MITSAPRKEFTLDYPISQVVTTVNSTLRLAGHRLLDSNNVLKTYRIAIVYGFNTAIMTVQLNQVGENSTKCTFEIFNTTGSRVQPGTLTGMLDKYLLTFTNLLTGKIKIIEKPQPQPQPKISPDNESRNNNPVLKIVLAVIVIAIIVYLFVSK
ncbi:MAG TPA: hypothetical protein VIM07_15105 [Chitinophagaceae bacterium]